MLSPFSCTSVSTHTKTCPLLSLFCQVFEFGFFVDVGAKANGLVHISSINEQEDR